MNKVFDIIEYALVFFIGVEMMIIIGLTIFDIK